eukprot:TRINITY_DN4296_c0_g1_i11.p1 TRINITY_DN4296_c0_g1~~TRINITY_DN4296_c0_g1_i11.p1  ORF type:complete len:333 (-),score=67.78 TRINITY_DN4296_c0_g1_i11:153-1151(-)
MADGQYGEVGNVPGTYRIIDLFCLKEVLNQIMRCSCNSDQGFAIYQYAPESSSFSFHTVLDILCKNCKRKISFGTSIIRKGDLPGGSECADVDLRLDSTIGYPAYKEKLWTQFYSTAVEHTQQEQTIVLDSSATRFDFNDGDINEDRTSPELKQPTPDQSQVTRAAEPLTATKLPQQNFQCHFCSKLFKKHYNLQQHLRIHTKETIKCPHENCTSKFKDKSTLNKHVKSVHLQQKPFSCVTCGKAFKRRDHLKHHFAVHTGERKYACDVCDMSFSFQSTLQKHKRVHSVLEVVKCRVCGKDFRGEHSLKKHVKKFHVTTVETGNISAVQPPG